MPVDTTEPSPVVVVPRIPVPAPESGVPAAAPPEVVDVPLDVEVLDVDVCDVEPADVEVPVTVPEVPVDPSTPVDPVTVTAPAPDPAVPVEPVVLEVPVDPVLPALPMLMPKPRPRSPRSIPTPTPVGPPEMLIPRPGSPSSTPVPTLVVLLESEPFTVVDALPVVVGDEVVAVPVEGLEALEVAAAPDWLAEPLAEEAPLDAELEPPPSRPPSNPPSRPPRRSLPDALEDALFADVVVLLADELAAGVELADAACVAYAAVPVSTLDNRLSEYVADGLPAVRSMPCCVTAGELGEADCWGLEEAWEACEVEPRPRSEPRPNKLDDTAETAAVIVNLREEKVKPAWP